MRKKIHYSGLAVIFLAVLLISACAKRPQYTPVFAGKNIDIWQVKKGPADDWSIIDGTLYTTGVGGGWIGTRKTYKDFIFSCEWKVGYDGNSGVFIRVSDEPDQNPAYDAIEIQIGDDTGERYQDSKSSGKSGAIYAVVGPPKDLYRGTFEWNKFVITCKGTKIKVEFNGEVVVNVDAEDYKEALDWYGTPRNPLYDRPREGYIALQSHGGEAWFRNIQIKELK